MISNQREIISVFYIQYSYFIDNFPIFIAVIVYEVQDRLRYGIFEKSLKSSHQIL